MEILYNEINKIDKALGLFEIKLNQELELEMDSWTHNNIIRLEKQKMNQYFDNNQLQPYIDHSTFESAHTKNKKESSFELDPVHCCVNKFV